MIDYILEDELAERLAEEIIRLGGQVFRFHHNGDFDFDGVRLRPHQAVSRLREQYDALAAEYRRKEAENSLLTYDEIARNNGQD